MVGYILQIVISVGLIIGGLSGKLVFRGTNSSAALVVFGVVWLIIDIIRLIVYVNRTKSVGASGTGGANDHSAEVQKGGEFIKRIDSIENLAYPMPITLSVVQGARAGGPYMIVLNGAPVGNLETATPLKFEVTKKRNVITAVETTNNNLVPPWFFDIDNPQGDGILGMSPDYGIFTTNTVDSGIRNVPWQQA
ncbi:MAG: hypothetical protein LBQ95_00225 [Lachnospiraceae bacterium]|jgi:hypothetical protein|nr:hypothetical protein [Lachnospiraceae bacterium]